MAVQKGGDPQPDMELELETVPEPQQIITNPVLQQMMSEIIQDVLNPNNNINDIDFAPICALMEAFNQQNEAEVPINMDWESLEDDVLIAPPNSAADSEENGSGTEL